jgi:hypothetical protein
MASCRKRLDGWMSFVITSGNDDNLDGNNDRPNLLPGKSERVLDARRSRLAERSEWFDTTAYCCIATTGCPAGGGPSGRDGLVWVNFLDGPGCKDVDASVFRDFNIYERVKFQFRGEATNVFNFVNLSNPGGTLCNTSSFGVITSAANTSAFGSMRVLLIGG